MVRHIDDIIAELDDYKNECENLWDKTLCRIIIDLANLVKENLE